jgi:hypothetical protein
LLFLLGLGRLFSLFWLLHVGHVDVLWVFLEYEYVRLHEFDASIVGGDLHIEVRAQELKKILAFDVRIQCVSASSEDEQRPEEIDEDGVHDGVVVDGILNADSALSEHSEELHDELLELQVIEDLGVVLLIEHELKLVVVDELLNLPNVAFKVNVFEFEAELQVLVVEDSDVGLRVIAEVLDHSGRIDEVVLEEERQGVSVTEDLEGAVRRCETIERLHHSEYKITMAQ